MNYNVLMGTLNPTHSLTHSPPQYAPASGDEQPPSFQLVGHNTLIVHWILTSLLNTQAVQRQNPPEIV